MQCAILISWPTVSQVSLLFSQNVQHERYLSKAPHWIFPRERLIFEKTETRFKIVSMTCRGSYLMSHPDLSIQSWPWLRKCFDVNHLGLREFFFFYMRLEDSNYHEKFGSGCNSLRCGSCNYINHLRILCLSLVSFLNFSLIQFWWCHIDIHHGGTD